MQWATRQIVISPFNGQLDRVTTLSANYESGQLVRMTGVLISQPFPRKLSANFANLFGWLNLWCLAAFQQYFSYIAAASATIHAFLECLFTSTPHNIPSEPLAAVSHNHCRKNAQRWEGNESCRNDYHNPRKEYLTSRASDLLFLSLARYRLCYGVLLLQKWK